MAIQKRKYELKARAERQRETRERIARAAAELHEQKGVARTTVADIARRAGVQRLTVYNHFRDESELFPACTTHYLALHPPPELDAAFALEDPRERVRAVLSAFYRWYRETESMMSTVNADRHSLPALDEFCKQTWDPQFAELSSALAAGFDVRGSRAERLQALVGVALDFWTWRRLDRAGLGDDAAADLMTDTVAAETNSNRSSA
jgi:AcrR family transcriptional regulator